MTYFAPRVRDAAYRPVAGSLPTTDDGRAVEPGHGIGGAVEVRNPAEPSRQGAPPPATGTVAVPGSGPVVIDDVVQSSGVNRSTFVAPPGAAASSIVIEECDFRPGTAAVVSIEQSPRHAPGLEPLRYPRAPVERHKRKRRVL